MQNMTLYPSRSIPGRYSPSPLTIEFLKCKISEAGFVRPFLICLYMSQIDQLKVNDQAAPRKENICCVIVTFHPDDSLADRIKFITNQVDSLIFIDNSSTSAELDMLKNIAASTGAALIQNDKNLGIPAALNQGVQWAKSRGYQWVLTLDQDTLTYDSLVEGLIEAYDSFDDKSKVAIIGANFIDRSLKKPLFSGDDSQTSSETIAVITSGSLVSLKAYETIGLFREDLFIDRVDFEYCLRARANGLKVLITHKPLMEHGIGTPEFRRFLGKKILTPNNPPERHYYIARNHITLVKEYFFKEPAWVKESIITRTKELAFMLLLEGNKIRKSWMVLRGTIDGLIGRMGPLH